MKRWIKQNVRIGILLVLLGCFSVPIYSVVKGEVGFELPKEVPYEPCEYTTEYELDDYIITLEQYTLDSAIVTHKKTGLSKRLFDDPLIKVDYIIHFLISGNSIYYIDSMSKKIYCYDVDKNIITEIYELKNYGVYITVFDVLVYSKTASREEREEVITNFAIWDGKLVIGTDKKIFIYDGRKEEVLVRGNYGIHQYKDGVITLSRTYKDENLKTVISSFEYNLEKRKLKLIEEKLMEEIVL